jgi:hypothetical protein
LCEEAFYEEDLFASGLFLSILPSNEAAAIATGFCCPFLTTATEKCDPNASVEAAAAAGICEAINFLLLNVAGIDPCPV